MRFFADGPSIPDDLLTARDEGRVVFFCGAGVSRAKAGLANFFGLAEEVLAKLSVEPHDPAARILREAKEIESRAGSGLISADRIFGLLERDFPTRDIEQAVAQALRPKESVDLSAHRVLLDLATTSDGKVRLVTTNFDRLFESCNEELQAAMPPHLPDPTRPEEINGIVHLHGRVTADYNGSEAEGFVLSSSEFGKAYLSDGWATRFFREILSRFVVVFIGYTADDPPVQYLLEALHKSDALLRNVYAFQAGPESEVAGRWRHKGVQAIAYSDAENHSALWKTLEAWAERAKNPDAWRKAVVQRACAGPRCVEPHERGQVAHLVSTLEGVREFANSEPPPPAEWLCVFDPYRRYARPGRTIKEREPAPLPFDSYGLDFDAIPSQPTEGEQEYDAALMKSAWDAFAVTHGDSVNLRSGGYATMRGTTSRFPPRQPPRLEQLGGWLARVSHQPASAWWAAHQGGLHPDVQRSVRFALERSEKTDDVSAAVRAAWLYLLEVWQEEPDHFRRDWHELRSFVKRDGWTRANVRRYCETLQPFLKAQALTWNPFPPPDGADLERIVYLDVSYPDHPEEVLVPDEYLKELLRGLRLNILQAIALERELSSYELETIEPIEPDVDTDFDRHSRRHGMSGRAIEFSRAFKRLLLANPAEAKAEFAAWPVDDPAVFAKLRVWAAGNPEVVPDESFGLFVDSLDQRAFWASRNQRDLLLVLARRWSRLDEQTRHQIEKRLVGGPDAFPDEDEKEYRERKAWNSLCRLHWLALQECSLQINLDALTEKLSAIATDWELRDARQAASHVGARGGMVRTNTEHSELASARIEDVLSIAQGRTGRGAHFLEESDPFLGLSERLPVRAFRVLVREAKRGSYPEWAWRTFFRAERSRNAVPRLRGTIAARLATFPESALAPFVPEIASWMTAGDANNATPDSFRGLVSVLTRVLANDPPVGRSGITRTAGLPDWVMEAINSPSGQLVQCLVRDSKVKDVSRKTGFPAEWLAQMEALLGLSGNSRRYALVVLSHQLQWLYFVDPKWTERNLLSAMEGADPEDQNAAWSGFLWGGRLTSPDLYKRLKSRVLDSVLREKSSKRGHGEILAGMILAGWNSKDSGGIQFISNAEFRSVLLKGDEEFRLHVLWHLKNWSSDSKNWKHWCAQKVALLQDVWPRQKAVKSPRISARLSDIAFSSTRCFPDVADAVLPLLTVAEQSDLFLPELRKSKDTIVDRHPEKVMAVLHAILPEGVAHWPWGTGEIIQRLIDKAGHPISDAKLVELKRRWESR